MAWAPMRTRFPQEDGVDVGEIEAEVLTSPALATSFGNGALQRGKRARYGVDVRLPAAAFALV